MVKPFFLICLASFFDLDSDFSNTSISSKPPLSASSSFLPCLTSNIFPPLSHSYLPDKASWWLASSGSNDVLSVNSYPRKEQENSRSLLMLYSRYTRFTASGRQEI